MKPATHREVSPSDQNPSAKNMPKLRSASEWFSYVLLVGGLGVIVFAAYSVYLVYSPLPWVDQWMFLQELVGNHGHYSAGLLWHQHNEHRSPVPKLFYLADLYLTHGSNALLLAAIFCFQLFHTAALAAIFRRIGGFRRAAWWTSVALACTCLFAMRQSENFWFGSCLPMVLAYLGATVVFGSVGLYRLSLDEGKGSLRFVVFACTGALVASLSLANGLLLWPMLVLILLVWRVPVRVVWAVAALGGLLFAAWIPGYETQLSAANALSLPRLAEFVLLLYGSSWSCVGETFGVVAAGIAIPVTMGAYIWVLWKRGSDRLATVLLSIAAFALASTLVTAVGRLGLGLAYARSSRYQIAATLFWCCTFALAIRKVSVLRNRTALLALQVAFVCVLLAAARLAGPVADGARLHTGTLRAAAVALEAGVKDSSAAMYATVSPYTVDDLLVVCDFLRVRRWSIFSDGERYPLGRSFSRYYRVAPATACRGSIDVVKPIRDYRRPGFRFGGWAYDVAAAAPATAVVLTDPGGRLIGVGQSGFRRPDVPAVVPSIISMDTGYLGYIPADLEASEAAAFAILADGVSACPLTSAPLHLDWKAVAYSGPQPTGATLTMTLRTGQPFMNIEKIGESAPGPSGNPVVMAGDRGVKVAGWIIGPDRRSGSGADLVIDGVPIAARYGLERPDVAKAMQSPDATRSGFEVDLPTLEPGEHTITIRVVARDQLRYFQGWEAKITVR